MNQARQTQRLHRVADHIERHAATFSMHRLQHDCGTPACIAGHTLALFDHSSQPGHRSPAELLSLTDQQAEQLFAPGRAPADPCRFKYYVYPREPGHITAAHAVRTLRHFADSGVIDWEATAPTTHRPTPCVLAPPPPHS